MMTGPSHRATGLALYNAPGSTCSQKVRLALAEKGLPWQDCRMDLRANEHLADWYLALNPNAVVPTLVHDGRVVVDSSVINEYLEEVFPQVPLMPAAPYERARMRAWRQYIDEVPTPAIRVPSFNAFILQGWSGMSDEEYARAVEKRTVRRHFYRRMGRGGFSQDDVNEALERLRDALARMERSLSAGPWLLGELFTLADLSLVPTVVRLDDLALSHLWSDLPRVGDWYARVRSLPSFATAYYEGSRPRPVTMVC
jgi:glutathione S-transferase